MSLLWTGHGLVFSFTDKWNELNEINTNEVNDNNKNPVFLFHPSPPPAHFTSQ